MAAPQRLLEVRADSPEHLVRVAYHIGNRHAPAEVAADALYIEHDHVLAEMVRAQGCTATPVMRPFQPERGAYEHEGSHTHGNSHAPHPPHGPVHPHEYHPGADPGSDNGGPGSKRASAGDLMSNHLPLLIWLSPSFPVGAFAYSHGLEWAHEAGDVTDAATLQGWIGDLLAHGAARNDAVLFVESYRASEANDAERLRAVAEVALALANSAERWLETTTQGDAFLQAIERSWPCAAAEAFRRVWADAVAYPVAVGIAAAGHRIPVGDALPALLLGFVSNLVSAAVRLGIVGQTDGQRTIVGLIPALEELARIAQVSTLDDLGAAAFRSDLAALRHETQYTRLFRS